MRPLVEAGNDRLSNSRVTTFPTVMSRLGGGWPLNTGDLWTGGSAWS